MVKEEEAEDGAKKRGTSFATGQPFVNSENTISGNQGNIF
jgi:hypothetical protein